MSSVSFSSKGQSAIEYLMTYGWMLLVVAIVGGAIFAVVQQQNVESTSGFTGGDVAVENFGLSSEGSLDMVLRNTASDSVEINRITLSQDGKEVVNGFDGDINVGDSLALSNDYVANGSSTGSIDVEIVYEVGGLTNQVATGTVSGGFDLTPPTESWTMDIDDDGNPEQAEYQGEGTEIYPYSINSLADLQAIDKNDSTRGYSYGINSNIDASSTSSWNGGSGFAPIAQDTNFTGSLEGNGNEVTGLYINRPSEDKVGLFGDTINASITNLELNNVDITGNNSVGALVGDAGGPRQDGGYRISNVHVKGMVAGNDEVGGMIGVMDDNTAGLVEGSSSEGTVEGDYLVGGLIGYRHAANDNEYVRNSYSSANVDGGKRVGGLVGWSLYSQPIKDSYATGDVNGSEEVGGLVGFLRAASVETSYATGNITGNHSVGGLVGDNRGDIRKAFATADVTGETAVGGLVGGMNDDIKNSYALGNVDGSDEVGGLLGEAYGFIEAANNSYSGSVVNGNTDVGGLVGAENTNGDVNGESYWDVPTSGQDTTASLSGVGLGELSDSSPATKMTGTNAESSMNSLDFDNVWGTVSGDYPVLQDIDREEQLNAR